MTYLVALGDRKAIYQFGENILPFQNDFSLVTPGREKISGCQR